MSRSINLSDKKTCSEYGRRATATRHAQMYCIEGENVTMHDIAAKLKVTNCTAYARLKRARALPGAVTWKSLGLKA